MLLALGIAYGLLVVVAAIFQRRLIYFPRTIPPELAEPAAASNGLVPWRNPAGQIIGWKLPAASAPTASVLIAHGNAGCAIDRGYLAGPIHDAAAVDVYVLEYPGYGARGGLPGKQVFFAAGEEAFGLMPNGRPKYLVRFHPAADLGKYQGPVKMVIAGADEIIPPMSGQKLFAEYHGPKDLQVISGARHNDVAAQSPDWWRQTFSFWRQNHPANPGRSP